MERKLVILGAQWGDEGKGKIVDLLSENYDVVVRYQGEATQDTRLSLTGRRSSCTSCPRGYCTHT